MLNRFPYPCIDLKRQLFTFTSQVEESEFYVKLPIRVQFIFLYHWDGFLWPITITSDSPHTASRLFLNGIRPGRDYRYVSLRTLSLAAHAIHVEPETKRLLTCFSNR